MFRYKNDEKFCRIRKFCVTLHTEILLTESFKKQLLKAWDSDPCCVCRRACATSGWDSSFFTSHGWGIFACMLLKQK